MFHFHCVLILMDLIVAATGSAVARRNGATCPMTWCSKAMNVVTLAGMTVTFTRQVADFSANKDALGTAKTVVMKEAPSNNALMPKVAKLFAKKDVLGTRNAETVVRTEAPSNNALMPKVAKLSVRKDVKVTRNAETVVGTEAPSNNALMPKVANALKVAVTSQHHCRAEGVARMVA